MAHRSAELGLGIILVLAFLLTNTVAPVFAEPTLIEVLNSLGFTNITESTVETFPSGMYEITLYAEFAGYHSTNELSYYPMGTSDFTLIFSGPEGNNGYITPPIVKTFSCNTTFGLSMYVASEGHRYFTETLRNPDGLQHSKIYVNLDEPDMYLIGFENLYGSSGDRDYQDMVLSLQPVKHYLTVETDPPGITTIPGEDWYYHCTEVTLTAPSTIPVSTGTQYRFNNWDIDGNPKSGNPIIVHMDADHTATAHYILQYYLTVDSPYDSPGGEGWYDSDTTAHATLDTDNVDHGNGTRRIFTSWGGDASGTNYAQSNPILMDAPKTAIANWKTQYYLTLATNPSSITTPSGSEWYDVGTYASISTADVVDIALGSSRYKFTGWTTADMSEITDPSSPSTIVLMDKPKTVTANYKTQYYLTVTSPYGIPGGQGWYDSGSTAYATLNVGMVDHGNETRRIFTSWSIDASGTNYVKSDPILMDRAKTATANWKTQYYLTVETNPAGIVAIPGEGWYDKCTDVLLMAPDVLGYTFDNWIVDGISPGTGIKAITVSMSRPRTAIANYSPIVVGGSTFSIQSPLIYAWISVNALLVAAVLITKSWIKSRQKKT